MKTSSLIHLGFLLTASAFTACGPSGGKSATQPTSGDASGVNDPEPNANPLALSPSARDLASNSETQAQVAQNGMASAASAAATGLTGTGSPSSSLALTGLGLAGTGSSPVLGQPTDTVTSGDIARDCYLGSTLQGRTGPLTWPESTDPNSIFSDSKNDPTNSSNMYVEPLLLQYPAQSPQATLTLSAPFAFANLAEVIQSDNRDINITLNDLAQTQITETSSNQDHRFWVAANPITGQTSPAIACGPTTGTTDKGSSGMANGSYARIKWSDPSQVNGLNLLSRFENSGYNSHTYLPRHNGVYAATAVTIDSNTGASGYRLATWTTGAAGTGAVDGAAIVRQKTVTHVSNNLVQTLDANHNVISDVSHVDEVRATSPLVIQSFFDANEAPLAELITSGTVDKTATDTATGAVKWFSTLTFSGVEYDLQNSTEVCIPVAGTVVMTVFTQEGGTQLKQITINYSSVPSTGESGKVDPQISVVGDDADGTQAKWMMLSVDRKCDLK